MPTSQRSTGNTNKPSATQGSHRQEDSSRDRKTMSGDDNRQQGKHSQGTNQGRDDDHARGGGNRSDR
jgi:hypothetical protein